MKYSNGKKINKAIILDRDGVINVDTGYVHQIKEFEFIKGSIEALKLLQKDYLLIIFTNQSGIGRGYFSLEDYYKLTDYMLKEFKGNKINITEIIFCPHHPEEDCECRKPSIKAIEKLIEKHNINLKESYVIGDKTSDIQLGVNLGSKTVLVKTGKRGEDKLFKVKPDIIEENLAKAAKTILS